MVFFKNLQLPMYALEKIRADQKADQEVDQEVIHRAKDRRQLIHLVVPIHLNVVEVVLDRVQEAVVFQNKYLCALI